MYAESMYYLSHFKFFMKLLNGFITIWYCMFIGVSSPFESSSWWNCILKQWLFSWFVSQPVASISCPLLVCHQMKTNSQSLGAPGEQYIWTSLSVQQSHARYWNIHIQTAGSKATKGVHWISQKNVFLMQPNGKMAPLHLSVTRWKAGQPFQKCVFIFLYSSLYCTLTLGFNVNEWKPCFICDTMWRKK